MSELVIYRGKDWLEKITLPEGEIRLEIDGKVIHKGKYRRNKQ